MVIFGRKSTRHLSRGNPGWKPAGAVAQQATQIDIEQARTDAFDAEIRRYIFDPDFETLCGEIEASLQRLGMIM